MNVRSTTYRIGVAALLLMATISRGEVLYSTENCSPNPLANFWRCPSLQTDLLTDRPTATDSALIQSFTYENRLEIVFQCQASLPFPLEYQIGTSRASLAATKVATAHVLVTPVPYEAQKVTLSLSPAANSIVLPGCKVEIFSNVTTPAMNEIKRHAETLSAAIEEKVSAQRQLSEAATLPAKWVVVRELSNRLQTQVDFKRLKRAELLAERRGTDALDLEIAELTLLIHQLDDAMPANDLCSVEGSSPNAFCLTKVEAAKAGIDSRLTKDLEAARQLVEFLEAEISRLADRATSVTTKLQEVLAALSLHTEEL